jgi:hypothetical protein
MAFFDDVSALSIAVIGLLSLTTALAVAGGTSFAIPGADAGLMNAEQARDKALAAEAKQDWDSALANWERVIDRCVSTRAQRLEAYEHIYSFRDKVKPLNTDPAKAKPWPTLVVVFKKVDFSWDGGKNRFQSTVNESDMADIRKRVDAFAKYVFTFSDGTLNIVPDYLVVEEPLTHLEVIQGAVPAFIASQATTVPMIVKGLEGNNKRFEHTLVYVKYVGDDGKAINTPYQADTGGGGPGGASLMTYPLYPGSYNNQQPGEIELHEFLHPVDMIFNDVLGYPDTVVCSPDEGSSDNIYKAPAGEVGMVSLYEYLFRVRYTRLMWSELTQLEPKEFFWGGPNLSDWLVLGPFTAPEGKDPLDEAFINETGVQPAEGVECAGKRWTHVRSVGGVIDLSTVLGGQKNAVAYLATNQRICGKYKLRMGSNGGLKAWLNGQPVHTARGARDFAFNQDTADVTFLPDFVENPYLFKVQSSDKGWKFQARVSGANYEMPWGSRHILPGAK